MQSCVSRLVFLSTETGGGFDEFSGGERWADGMLRFERFHQALVPIFVMLVACLLIAERMVGGFLRRKCGSKSLLLEPYSAAVFASFSAASFPS